MFLFSHPSDDQVRQFLKAQERVDFSYPEVGSTGSSVPAGYNIDHNRIRLGNGIDAFHRAKAAIQAWKMFDLPWVKLYYPDTPIEVGRTVAILVRHFGFYSLNAARIVYLIDEEADIHRFGFVYGTLAEHSEIGEERFSVEYDPVTGDVWYDLFAFSRPGHYLAKLGYPLSRFLQKAFAEESKRTMLQAVSSFP
jgi:uncharacterized protein (UPF0548 family)